MLDFNLFIYLAITIFLSATIQGVAGFGFALISVPIMSIFSPITTVIPIIVFYSLISNFTVIFKTLKFTNFKKISPMIISGIIGIPIGASILKTFNPTNLKIAVGFVILFTSFIMLKGYKIRFKKEKVSYIVTGLISGILNGSLSMSGPPIVLFLNNEGYNKNEFRANLALYSIITNILTIFTYIVSGLFSEHIVKTSLIGIIPLILGSYFGIFISEKIENHHFKKLILILLIITGGITVIKSLVQL